MSQQTDPGRLDHAVARLFRKGLRTMNPLVRIGYRMVEDEIEQILKEELGPGTKADKIGRRIQRAIDGERRGCS